MLRRTTNNVDTDSRNINHSVANDDVINSGNKDSCNMNTRSESGGRKEKIYKNNRHNNIDQARQRKRLQSHGENHGHEHGYEHVHASIRSHEAEVETEAKTLIEVEAEVATEAEPEAVECEHRCGDECEYEYEHLTFRLVPATWNGLPVIVIGTEPPVIECAYAHIRSHTCVHMRGLRLCDFVTRNCVV